MQSHPVMNIFLVTDIAALNSACCIYCNGFRRLKSLAHVITIVCGQAPLVVKIAHLGEGSSSMTTA